MIYSDLGFWAVFGIFFNSQEKNAVFQEYFGKSV